MPLGHVIYQTVPKGLKMAKGATSSFNAHLRRYRKLGSVDYDSGGMRVHSSLLNVVLQD